MTRRSIQEYVSRQVDDALMRKYYNVIENRIEDKPLKHVYLCVTRGNVYNICCDLSIEKKRSIDKLIEIVAINYSDITKEELTHEFVKLLSRRQYEELALQLTNFGESSIEDVTNAMLRYCLKTIRHQIDDYLEERLRIDIRRHHNSSSYHALVNVIINDILKARQIRDDNLPIYMAISNIIEHSCPDISLEQRNKIVDSLYMSDLLGV